MEGELHRLEREVLDLKRSVDLVCTRIDSLATRMDRAIMLLEPSTTYPASTGGTVTIK